MTLIAIIKPVNESPLFISDTLITSAGNEIRHVEGPHGLILPSGKPHGRVVHELAQKSLVIGKCLYVSYAGKQFLGEGVVRTLFSTFSDRVPTLEAVCEVMETYASDLHQHDTTVLIATFERDDVQFRDFGPAPDRLTLQDGTVLVVTGSGTAAFVMLIKQIARMRERKSSDTDKLGMKWHLLAAIANYSALEGVSGKFDDWAGGIVEVAGVNADGFERLAPVAMVSQLFEVREDTMVVRPGNYLYYRYYDDVLAFLRVGGHRQSLSIEKFGTDTPFASTVRPPHRQCAADENEVYVGDLEATFFEDNEFVLFSWSNIQTPLRGKVNIFARDDTAFSITRNAAGFLIRQTPEFLERIANQFNLAAGVFEA